MNTTLRTDITVADICDGFVYNQLEGKGLFGLGGKLTIQPEYQRNYIYADGGGKKEAATVRPRTARCSALPTIAPKVIDNMGVPQPRAWSTGGKPNAASCQMLRSNDNRRTISDSVCIESKIVYR